MNLPRNKKLPTVVYFKQRSFMGTYFQDEDEYTTKPVMDEDELMDMELDND